MRRWPFWSLPLPARGFLLLVELAAAAVVAWLLTGGHPSGSALWRLGLLVLLAVGYAEVTDRVERIRYYLGSDQAWADQTAVWIFAGALVLPPALAGALAVLVYGHVFVLKQRHKSARPHRLLYTAAAVVLAALAASGLTSLGHAGGLPNHASTALIVCAALVCFTGTNLLLILAGMFLAARPPSVRLLVPGRDEWAVEIRTLLLGVVTAEFAAHTPLLTPVVIVLAAGAHRAALVAQLRTAAHTDTKTGLLNPSGWRAQADQVLLRAQRDDTSVAVLVADLDRFKDINDRFGHLAGDAALRAVADCLREQLRGNDAIGRFGGEEFIAVLDGVGLAQAHRIAERLREQVAQLRVASGARLTVSIGVTAGPAQAADLDQMMHAADTAMYEAKRCGRDTVRATAATG